MEDTALRAHLQKIKLLVCDVDGVLTAGGIIIDDQGRETKRFDVKDDHGLKLLQRAGLQVALLSGRSSDIVTHRAKELNISYTIQGAKDKRKAYATLKQECGYQDDEIAYVGDDVVDIPILTQVGVAIAVQDAVEEVKAVAQYITARPGGHGAIREVVHLILKAQNHWKRLMERYYQ